MTHVPFRGGLSHHRTALALATAIVFSLASNGQVATNYNFSQAAGSYSSISGGTQLWGGILQLDNIDDNVSGAQTIPAFNYGGTIYTQMYVSSNGFITFGSAPATNNYTPISSSAGYAGAISAFGTDLQNTNASFGFAQREVRWEYVGTEIVIQWKGMRRKSVSNENFNFQIRLNTSSSVIRCIYNTIAGQGSATTFQPEVGLRGPNNTFATNVNNRLVGTGAENWATSLAGTANNSAMRFTTAAPAKAFTNGLTYSWTPNCTQPSATTTVIPNCNTNTYTVQVTVTSLGNAPNVDLTSSVGGLFADNVGLGTYTSPAVAIGTPSAITVVHNTNAICSVPLGTFNPVVSCSGACLTPTLTIPTDGCSSSTNLNTLIPINYPGTALGTDVLLQSVDLILAADLLNNSDFQIRLISPSGQSRNLVLSRFGNGTNIGNPSNCPNSYLRLIDGGTALTNSSINNVTGNYAPEQTLAGFTGNPNGVWTLRICDNGIFLTGALKFVRLNFVTRGSGDPCAPRVIACNDTRTVNSTASYANTLPASACNFNGAATTGGTHWWSYTAASSGEATVTLCGNTTFNSRVSAFLPTPACSNLTCVGMNDDQNGCAGNSSELKFSAQSGQTYLIAVHGSGAAAGTYSISIFCDVPCAPATSNDACGTATVISSVLADGSGVPLLNDNTCAHVDDPTTSSGALPAVGLWYTFNSGAHAIHRLHVRGHSFNPNLTANNLSYALYAGTCTNLGASGELVSVGNAPALNALPLLTPNTDYRLLIYNRGGVGEEGTFRVMVDHPGTNDAGITLVSSPNGVVCGHDVLPVATLQNFGEAALTNVFLEVSIDGGPVLLSYPWTGNLAMGASEVVALPAVTTPNGVHTLHVTVVSPNGQADEIAANNTSSSNYSATGNPLRVVIHTDGNGGQTTWEVFDGFFLPVANGGPYANNTTVVTDLCLSSDLGSCYSFFVYDSFGDGMCCGNGNGFWELRTPDDQVLLRDKGEFASISPTNPPATPAYALGHTVCLPLGPSDILNNECGVFTNNLLNKVYCEAVPGVALYQFEFSDPDAGFRRRIVVDRNWVTFGEMVTNPLLPSVTYFTRVRADQGAPGFLDDHFGAGCEMGIDPDAVPGCTQLIDDMALPTHSCGVTKTFGGSDKIWAQPVVGGTLYKFRFTNTGEGYERSILRTNYVCILNWTTNPLVNGSTYDVQVNVLVNGQWSGYCGATCQVTIMNPPVNGGELHALSTMERTDDVALQLYPNPVTNGTMTLQLNGLSADVHQIAMDVFSTEGQRVMSEQFSNEGAVLRTIHLDPAMGAGVYIVNVTVDGAVYTQRIAVY